MVVTNRIGCWLDGGYTTAIAMPSRHTDGATKTTHALKSNGGDWKTKSGRAF